jgi:hypothetical protein
VRFFKTIFLVIGKIPDHQLGPESSRGELITDFSKRSRMDSSVKGFRKLLKEAA